MRKERGALGEKIALRYLLRLGYTLVEKNWTARWAEIDLIMLDDSSLVFVEVKCRTSKHFGDIDSVLTEAKRLHLQNSIDLYLSRCLSHSTFLTGGNDYRFDFVYVYLTRMPARFSSKSKHLLVCSDEKSFLRHFKYLEL